MESESRKRGRPPGGTNPNAGRPTNAEKGIEERQRISARFRVGTIETLRRITELLQITQTGAVEFGVTRLSVLLGETITLDGGGIYVIRNTIDGGFYIGRTMGFAHRWSIHRNQLLDGKHHCKRMQEAFDNLGDAGWEFTPLELCDESIAWTRERYWIAIARKIAGELCYNDGHGGVARTGSEFRPLGDTAKFTVNISDKFDGLIAALAAQEETSKSEIIRRSVAVYALLKAEVKDAKKVAIVGPDGVVIKEIILP